MEIQLWKDILNPYELAVEELLVKFNHLIKEYQDRGMYSPMEQVCGRVKSISSILDKAQKKNIEVDKIEEQLDDIAGIRIICQFVEDIEKVTELIRNRSDMQVVTEKDYINHMKSSGYRSYHMIVSYPVETFSGTKTIRVEIQIRTLAMNFWSTIEHSLQYKYKQHMPDHIREELSRVADAIIVLDNEMSTVRSEIMDAQNSCQIQTNLVKDILNNIQNLYTIANKRELVKIQDEFYRIYETKDLEQLRRFHSDLDNITEGYHVQAFE